LEQNDERRLCSNDGKLRECFRMINASCECRCGKRASAVLRLYRHAPNGSSKDSPAEKEKPSSTAFLIVTCVKLSNPRIVVIVGW